MNLIAIDENNTVRKTAAGANAELQDRFFYWAASFGYRVIETEHDPETFPPADYVDDAGTIRKKSRVELVQDGLETLGPDEILDGDQIRSLDRVERIAAGLDPMPDGMKLDNGELVPLGSTASRRARAADYIAELSPEGDFTNSIGECLDALFGTVKKICDETGVAPTIDFADIVNKIQAVKDRHP